MRNDYDEEMEMAEMDEELDAWQEQMYRETVAEMTKTEKVVPAQDLKPVKEAAKDMTEQMHGYRQMEQDCGHSQPEVWQEHAKKQEKSIRTCRTAVKPTSRKSRRKSSRRLSKRQRIPLKKPVRPSVNR